MVFYETTIPMVYYYGILYRMCTCRLQVSSQKKFLNVDHVVDSIGQDMIYLRTEVLTRMCGPTPGTNQG